MTHCPISDTDLLFQTSTIDIKFCVNAVKDKMKASQTITQPHPEKVICIPKSGGSFLTDVPVAP